MSTNSVGFYYSDTFLLHRPPAGHPERPDRLRNIVTHLKSCGLWESFEHPTPVAAVAADILSVHTQEHLETIRRMCASGGGLLDEGDTHAVRESFDVAMLAAGSVLNAVDVVLG